MNRYAQIRRRREHIVYARHNGGRMVKLDQTGANQRLPDHLCRRSFGYLNKTYGPLGFILAPFDGDGAFSRWFPGERGVHWEAGDLQLGSNFLHWRQHVPWCLGNPPWRVEKRRGCLALIEHGYKIADNLALVLPVRHALGLRARIALAKKYGFGACNLILLPRFPTEHGFGESGNCIALVHWERGYHGKLRVVDWATDEWNRKAERRKLARVIRALKHEPEVQAY